MSASYFVNKTLKFGFFFWTLCSCVLLNASPLKRVEPLSWWVGMVNPDVQLMIYGDKVGLCQVALDYPGVSLTHRDLVENKNYLFITLTIGKSALPGQLRLQFSQCPDKQAFNYDFPLLAREPGSAQRQGFSQRDAIYLVVPDRFANGDTSNDASADTLEKPNRSEPGRRHGGDLKGLSQALPYIANMGFTQIWSTPLTENNGGSYSYHGYAATDLYRIDPRFGSNDDYRNFVRQAKKQGIGVINDIVLNHIGIDHWWMKDLPNENWINNKGQFTPTNHARTTVQDPYAAQIDKTAFVSGWFVPTMPDLNQQHPLLATYLIQNSIWWIEYAGLSGIREDTYSYADKEFLRQWGNHILSEYPHFTMVGEEWSENPQIVSYWQIGQHNHDGYQPAMPSMMDFPNYYALLAALNTQEDDDNAGWLKLYTSLVNDNAYPDPSKLVLFEGNHDTARLFSLLGNQFSRYTQAMVLMATLPRIPQFFYGTEILLESPTERNDGLVRSDFPGGWKNDKINGFNGKGLTEQQQQAQQLLKTLLNYRKHSPALQRGKMTHFYPVNGVYAYVRSSSESSSDHHPQQVWVFLSNNKQAVTLNEANYQELNPQQCEFTNILNQQHSRALNELTLVPEGALVLECQLRDR